MAFTQVTVTGTYQAEPGVAAGGTVTFTLTQPMQNSDVIVVPTPISVTLNSTGTFSVVLYANDDTATVPAGTYYGVTEQVSGAQPRDYFIQVSQANAPTVDISTLMPALSGWL